MEEPAQMTRRYRLAGSPALSSGKQPTFQYRRFPIVTRGPRLPPLPQQSEHLGREHNIAIFAALRLLDADDFLRAVDVFDLQPDHLARAQTAAIDGQLEKEAGRYQAAQAGIGTAGAAAQGAERQRASAAWWEACRRGQAEGVAEC